MNAEIHWPRLELLPQKRGSQQQRLLKLVPASQGVEVEAALALAMAGDTRGDPGEFRGRSRRSP